jgi:hypothetical protein
MSTPLATISKTFLGAPNSHYAILSAQNRLSGASRGILSGKDCPQVQPTIPRFLYVPTLPTISPPRTRARSRVIRTQTNLVRHTGTADNRYHRLRHRDRARHVYPCRFTPVHFLYVVRHLRRSSFGEHSTTRAIEMDKAERFRSSYCMDSHLRLQLV